eukprot:jgi/Mesen1/1843/ME000143S00897
MMVDADTPLLAEEQEDDEKTEAAWKDASAIHIGVDLLAASQTLLHLQDEVRAHPELYIDGYNLHEAIRRYRDKWMPLAAELSEDELSRIQPPLDVAYAEDCKRLVGRTIDCPEFPAVPNIAAALVENGRIYWQEKYPHEPYDFTALLSPSPEASAHEVTGKAEDKDEVKDEITTPDCEAGQAQAQAQAQGKASSSSSSSSAALVSAEPAPEAWTDVEGITLAFRELGTGTRTGAGTGTGTRTGTEPTEVGAEGVGKGETAPLEHVGGSAAQSQRSSPEQLLLPQDISGSSAASVVVPPLQQDAPVVTQPCPQPASTAAQPPEDHPGGRVTCSSAPGTPREPDCPPLLPTQLEEIPTHPLPLDHPPLPAAAAAAAAAASAGAESSQGAAQEEGEVEERSSAPSLASILAQVMKRHCLFFYQVDRACMRSRQYMAAAVQRYRMFLALLRRYPERTLVPAVDIDLVWHAHQMHSGAYRRDCDTALGRVVAHMLPAPAPAHAYSHGGEANGGSYAATAQLWEGTYGVPYNRAGALLTPPPLPLLPGGEGADADCFIHPTLLPSLGESERLRHLDVNQDLQLERRTVMQVHVTVWGLTAMAARSPDALFVRVQTLAKARGLSVATRPIPFARGWPLPAWRQAWWLECEAATEGLLLELWAQRSRAPLLGLLLGPRRVGSASAGCTLRVVVSGTPPEAAPYLLRTRFARPTDDTGAMISPEMVMEREFRPQPGRWAARTVLDHTNEEVFVVRTRIASGVWTSQERPEAVVLVHASGWTYLTSIDDSAESRIGMALGRVLAQAVPQPSPDFASEQNFFFLGCGEVARLKVGRDKHRIPWEPTLTVALSQEKSLPMRVLVGRHLEYRVSGASAEEEHGFLTLVRYSHRRPEGRATALVSWIGSAVEVDPQESVLLALLLCVTVSEAVQNMVGAVDRNTGFQPLFGAQGDSDVDRESITLQADGAKIPAKSRASSVGASYTGLSVEDEAEEGDLCEADSHLASAEEGDSAPGLQGSGVGSSTINHRWWKASPLKWNEGAGNCGAGGCGASSRSIWDF